MLTPSCFCIVVDSLLLLHSSLFCSGAWVGGGGGGLREC